MDKITIDFSEKVSRTYQLVDSAKNQVKTIKSVGWMWPEELPKMAHNYRATAEIYIALAQAVEMEELDGKQTLSELLDRIEDWRPEQ